MGLLVIDRSYTDAQGRTLSQHLSNALDVHDVVIRVELSYIVTLSGSVTITDDANYLFLPIGQTWESYGIVEGCTITGTIVGDAGSAPIPAMTTVDNVEGSTLVLSQVFGGSSTVYTSGQLEFGIVPEAFEFYYNLIESSNPSGDEFSLINGQVNKYYVQGIDAMAVGDMLPFNKAMIDASGGSKTFPVIERAPDSNTRRSYYIRIPNLRNYMYLDGDVFDSNNCVKPWYKLSAISQANNPSVRISNTSTFSQGNTGFFNESFNGNAPDYFSGGLVDGQYFVDDFQWTIGASVTPQFDHTQTTAFEIRVDGKFNATSKFGLAFFRVPDRVEYIDSVDEPSDIATGVEIEFYTTLAIAENMSVGAGNPDITGFLNSYGAGVEIIDIVIQQFGTYATITGKVVPNAIYTAWVTNPLHDSKLYRLAVKVEDYDLSGNEIRPVWLSADYRDSKKFVPPLGAWTDVSGFTTTSHADRAIPYIVGSGGLVADSLHTEDDINVQLRFKIPRPSIQAVNDQFFSGFQFGVVAKKFDGTFFEFETFNVPFPTANDGSVLVLPDDTTPLTYNQNRGLNLTPTSSISRVSVERYPTIDNMDNFGFELNYGMLLDWRYWLSLSGVDLEFFGAENRDWFHYQNTDWKIQLQWKLITNDGDYISYIDVGHKDYDDSEIVSTISFETLAGAPLTTVLSDTPCVAVATHVLPVGSIWVNTQNYACITVEKYEGSPRWVSSSYLPNITQTSSPLPPLAGEVGGKQTIVGDTLTIKCLFDPTNISTDGQLKFTSWVAGESRKGVDVDYLTNRTKREVTPVKPPKQFTPDPRELGDCCEPRIVVGHTSTDEYKNDVTGHWMAGEIVVFELLKSDGTPALVQPATLEFVQQQNMWYCQLNWNDIYNNSGAGCYTLVASVDYAGLNEVITVEKYKLVKFDENVIFDQVRITSVFNAWDVKNGVNFTGTKLVDSIRIGGQFGYNQPNTQVRNYTKTTFSQESITRQDRDSYELRTVLISDRFVKLLRYHLRHERMCLVSDYCHLNPRYDYKDTPVIVSETPNITYQETGSRKVIVTAKFEDKVLNTIDSFNNENPSEVIGNITFTSGAIPEDTTVLIYVDGILNDTVIVPFGDDATFNING